MTSHVFSITLYGRPGCHLCDDVEQSIRAVGRDIPLTLEVVNISNRPELEEKYLFTIPVVAVDGEVVFESVSRVVTETEFRVELSGRLDSKLKQRKGENEC